MFFGKVICFGDKCICIMAELPFCNGFSLCKKVFYRTICQLFSAGSLSVILSLILTYGSKRKRNVWWVID